MKVITNTYYQANDGTAFDTQDDCEEYERLIAADELDALFSESKGMYGSFGSFVSSNYGEIKEIMEGKTEDESTVSAEVDWSKVPAGTIILVRDFNDDEWFEYVFIVYKENDNYPYRCAFGERGVVYPISWKFAKLKP